MRVALTSLFVDLRPFAEREPDTHDDASRHLSVGADRVDDRPAVVRGRHAEDADDAGVAVDLDVGRMSDELRREERLVTEPADAALRVAGRRLGYVA